LLENLSVNSLKGDLSNATTVSPPLFSLVNTFKCRIYGIYFMYMYITGKGMKIKLCVSEQNKYLLHFAV
jgi:hypothetical protein